MPSIIANDVIGVSPFAPPNHRWGRDPQFARRPVPSSVYRVFLRLNNRLKTQSDNDFLKAGYYWVKVPTANVIAATIWCREQYGKHGSWTNYSTRIFWFENQKDQVAFQLAWS